MMRERRRGVVGLVLAAVTVVALLAGAALLLDPGRLDRWETCFHDPGHEICGYGTVPEGSREGHL